MHKIGDDATPTRLYRISEKEMYDHFMAVCKTALENGYSRCDTCPFKSFMVSAAQGYALFKNLEDPTTKVV